jgi:uncharacterized membrane protein
VIRRSKGEKMSDEEVPERTRRVSWVFRAAFAWIVLAVVIWAISGFLSDFKRANSATSATAGSGSASATSTPAPGSAVIGVTDLLATSRGELVLRAEPSESADTVAKVAEGSVLDVLAKQGTWFKVKDTAGRVGWVPNDTKYITVKKK